MRMRVKDRPVHPRLESVAYCSESWAESVRRAVIQVCASAPLGQRGSKGLSRAWCWRSCPISASLGEYAESRTRLDAEQQCGDT